MLGTRSESERRLRGLGAIAHPVALMALIVLVLHDVLLRPMLPPVVAGKVSDVAGMVVFPLVIAALIGLVVDDDDLPIEVGVWVTVVWFSAMKLVGAVASVTARLAEVVTPAASVTVDPTDLIALPAVLLAVWVWRHRVPPRAWGAPVLVFAVLWSAATSCDDQPHLFVGDVDLQSDGSFLVDGLPVRVTIDGRLEELDGPELDGRSDADPATTLSACLDGGTCFVGVGRDVVAVSPDGTSRTVVDINENRFYYAERTAGCGGAGPYRPVQDIAVNDADVVVVAHGSFGVSIRTADGTWTRPDVGATRLGGPVPVGLGTVAVALAVVGLLLSTLPDNYFAFLSVLAMVGAGAAAFLAAVGSFGLLLAWPALVVAGGVAVIQVAVFVSRVASRPAAEVVLGHLVAGVVAWLVIWGWSAGWIANVWIAVILGVVSVASVTVLSIVRGRRAGTWPMPPATPRDPSLPDGQVRGGPLVRGDSPE